MVLEAESLRDPTGCGWQAGDRRIHGVVPMGRQERTNVPAQGRQAWGFLLPAEGSPFLLSLGCPLVMRTTQGGPAARWVLTLFPGSSQIWGLFPKCSFGN